MNREFTNITSSSIGFASYQYTSSSAGGYVPMCSSSSSAAYANFGPMVPEYIVTASID